MSGGLGGVKQPSMRELRCDDEVGKRVAVLD
jgi:hypothetical protein